MRRPGLRLHFDEAARYDDRSGDGMLSLCAMWQTLQAPSELWLYQQGLCQC